MRGALLHGIINNGEISIHLTEKVMTYLDHARQPIYVGMELYFTYFMQKKVVFFDQKPEDKVTKTATNYICISNLFNPEVLK